MNPPDPYDPFYTAVVGGILWLVVAFGAAVIVVNLIGT